MTLTRELRNDAYKVYLLVGERDMPSNCTAERLVQRSGLSAARVMAALELLWNDDAGWIRVAVHKKSSTQGYYVDPKCRKKSPPDLDALFAERQAGLEEEDDSEGTDEDEDCEADPDDEWKDIDEDDDA